MKKERKKSGLISRRTFVKGVGAGAALALGGGLYPRPAFAKLVGNVPAHKFIYCWNTYYQLLDPHVYADVPPYSHKLNMYGDLYRYQDSPPKLVPWIAEGYEASPDSMEWTFHLKKGLKFHDDNEITAEDVRFSVERLMEMGKDAAASFKPFITKDAVKVIDKYTCQFNLEKPVGFFISFIPLLSIVNSKLVRKHDKDGDYGAAWLANNEAGSGAYMLKSWDPATGFTAVQWPGWAGGWAGKHFKEIEFTTIIETASRVAALLKGDINAVEPYLLPDQIKKLRAHPNTQVITVVGLRNFFIRLNYVRPPTSNIHFRRALSYAFPYNEFIEKAMLNNVVRARGGPCPSNLWGWPKDLKIFETDMKKAREELAIAKKELSPEEINRTLTIKAIKGFTTTKIAALYLQSAAADLGLTMKVQEEPWTVLGSATRDPKTTHDIWIHWMSAFYLDPDNWLGRLYSKTYHGALLGSTFYYDEKVEKLLEKGRAIPRREARQGIYEEVTRLLVEDAADIWISNDKYNGGFTSDVHGWRFCDIGSGQELYSMWRE